MEADSAEVRQIQKSQQTVQREFFAGLQAMSTQFDAMVQNFAWCAAQAAGAQYASSQLRGMLEFAQAYHKFGLETAISAIGENSGVPVDLLALGDKGMPGWYQNSIIVGLIGAEYIPEEYTKGKKPMLVFDGVAVIHGERGRETFVPVWIRPDGLVMLHPDYDKLQNESVIEKMFPPSHKGNRRYLIE